MSKVKSIFKRSLAILLAMLTIMSVGLTSIFAAYTELAETGANSTVSDGSYRLYFKFANNTTWWNGSGCYHFAWVWGTNMTSQWRAIYKVGTTNNESDGSTSSVYYMDIPSGTLTGMKLIRGKTSTTVTNGSTTYGSPSYYNCTNDITLSNSISTYNLITGVTENSSTFTHNSRYLEVEASSYDADVTNAQSGTGTEADPYIVTPGQTMNVSATSSIDDHNFTVNYGYNTSSNYTTSTTGTVTASSTADTSSSFRVYFTPLLGNNSSYTGTQTSVKLYYKTVDPSYDYEVEAGTGGTITSDTSGTVDKGAGATVTAQANEGYTFSGWTASGNGTFDDASAPSTTFYPAENGETATANFTLNSYTVDFYKYDGTLYHKRSVDHGSTVNAPDAPVRDGYTFLGWSTDGTVENIEDLTTKTFTSGGSYTAVYKEDEYTVDVITNGNGGTAYADKTSGIKYGEEVTLTAVPDTANGYKFAGWSITGDCFIEGDETKDESITITVKSDITVTANFKLNEYEVSVTYDSLHSSSASASSTTVEHGKTVTLTAEPDTLNGVQFAGWEIISGTYTITTGNLDSTSVTITVTSDITAKAKFTQLDSFTYTVSANPAEGGSVLPESNIVYDGSSVVFTAVANTGYVFENWTIVSDETYNVISGNVDLPSIGIIPHANVIVTANFEAVTGTINVTAGEGGTVTNTGTHNVTYPDTITATATPNESEGYQFTHWTVESDGEVNVDYKVTENDDEITVQILTQDTVVNVTANFANAQKIKVYTYSDSGFNRLTMTESDGTTTNTPVNNVTQSPVTFGEETWYTPGEVSLTPGYYDEITAQLSGDNPLTGGTGTLIMFDNVNVNWSKVHLYTNIKAYDSDGADLTNNGNHYALQNISGTTYWYTYISSTSEISSNVLFCDSEVGGWNNLNSGQKASYRTDASSNYSATPMFRPDAASNETLNSCPYYNNGSWVAKPTIDTDTDVLDITSMLYDGNTWKGSKEIWLYFDKTGKTVVATQRRDLNDYVTSAAVVQTYNNGKNDKGYDSSWDTFTAKYKAAVAVLGNGASTDDQLLTAKTDLETAINNLKLTENVTIIGSYGAEPQGDANTSIYYGRTTFEGMTTSTASGNIGDANGYHNTCTYITGSVKRDTVITIKTQLESSYVSDYLVYGWVVNGTGWIPATADIDTAGLYVGTYKCEANAVIVPIYFHKNTANNWETDSNIVKVYASTKGASEEWGNYIASYTWTTNKSYYQFGHWTGQLMIPDTANPGMYYTFVEMADSDNMSEVVAGITFNNYGANTPINQGARYQTYDYYEFIQLKNDEFNNIVFQLKTFEGNENYPQHNQNLEFANYKFDYFRDFSGNLIDIGREKIVEERTIPDPALYVVRTGPLDYNEGADQGWGNLKGSEFYVDAYLYKPDGTYLGRCKTYELTNLAKLKETRGIDLTTEEYVGKPVMVDYASLTNEGGNLRFDGEWFGTIYGLTNVTIKTEVAFQNENGEIEYFQGQNNVDGVGQAYFNGEHFQEVPHASEGHTISAIVAEGNDFVGWYKAIVADDGSYTIDATANPLFIERSATIDASADAVYVAVFKEHPEGTFTVNNYYYTYDDFKGQPMGEHLPPVFGGDTSYSIRDVKIQKTKNYDNSALTDKDNPGFAGTYTQSMEVAAGDELTITIRTTPTYTQRDYVYAWYIQANEADGKINFEEVGTNEIKGDTTPGATKEFTFTYTVEPGVDTITIYSDVVHITPEVTFTYIYNNRYNETRSYVVKHTLTDAELLDFDNLKDNEEFMAKIHNLAPYVADIYKNVTWEIENISSDATNWTLRASEADIYKVNVTVGEEVLSPPITGRFNETVSLYAKDIDPSIEGNEGIWYLDSDKDGSFTEGVDEILGLGSYYGLVITGDADVCFTNDTKVMNQIILADAVYGYERATDGSGSVTTNKVYVDYLISMLLNVYTGGYIDVNGNGEKDSNEPIVNDEENTNTPVSLKAITDAGYVVDYGMIHELLNTFGDNSDEILDYYYKSGYEMDNAKLTEMLKSGSGVAEGESYDGALATYFYHYSAIDYEDYATNKNRVIMTFGFDNNDFNRSMFYNVKAYLTISVPGTTTINDTNTMFVFSNQATLNIAEDDKITNGETTNS